MGQKGTFVWQTKMYRYAGDSCNKKIIYNEQYTRDHQNLLGQYFCEMLVCEIDFFSFAGICSCYEGYVEDDCSKQTSTPPSNILLPTNGLCGTRSRGCTRTNIFGAFPSTNVWCKRRHFQVIVTKTI